MRVAYNEIEPYCLDWLSNLMDAAVITPGVIFDRSIEDLRPDELRGFDRVHFFAGMGLWDRALDDAGWPDDGRVVFSGSCPCPPFSSAGRTFRCPRCDTPSPVPNALRTGMFNCVRCDHEWLADSRHLWPDFFRLIRHCRPDYVIGEQVSSPDGYTWVDVVRASLEIVHYAFGAHVAPAAGVGAPSMRHRIYWMADANSEPRRLSEYARRSDNLKALGRLPVGGMADPDRRQRGGLAGLAGRIRDRGAARREQGDGQPERGRAAVGLADAQQRGRESRSERPAAPKTSLFAENGVEGDDPLRGFWRGADWLWHRDGKYRPVKSFPQHVADGSADDLGRTRSDEATALCYFARSFPLAPSTPGRVGKLRAYGNAICLPQAVKFVEAVLACRP